MSPVLLMIPQDYDGQAMEISPKYSNTKEVENSSNLNKPGSTENESASEKKGNGVGTGDDAPVIWWGVLMIAAMSGFVLLLKRKAVKNREI